MTRCGRERGWRRRRGARRAAAEVVVGVVEDGGVDREGGGGLRAVAELVGPACSSDSKPVWPMVSICAGDAGGRGGDGGEERGAESSSQREGVRTARETAPQTELRSLGVHRTRALGWTSNPL